MIKPALGCPVGTSGPPQGPDTSAKRAAVPLSGWDEIQMFFCPGFAQKMLQGVTRVLFRTKQLLGTEIKTLPGAINP